MSRVFSVTDFKAGLDVRKSALTAPGGSLRILDNAVLTPGGEIEKRLAFVKMTTLPPETGIVFGQGLALHAFGVGLGAIDPGTNPIPIVPHNLAVPPGGTPVRIIDVEAFNDGFYVTGIAADASTCIWWNGVLVTEAPSGASHGTYARTYKTKMYRTDGRYLRFSGVNDPSVNDPASTAAPGAGFINVATNDPDGEPVESMEVFYDKMAVFARLLTQLWTLDPDPVKDTIQQVLRVGTVAPHSVHQFSTGDILFLADSGVRSLRSQTVTTAAAVSDVGAAIDPILVGAIRAAPVAAQRAQAVLQPIAGRYWLSLDDYVYVLSYFPAGKITAWSRFVPGFKVQEWASVGNRIYCRGPDQSLYLYGGVDHATYDSSRVTVRTPHHDVERPTERKRVQSVDVMCQGAWSVSLGMLPNNVDAFELVANVAGNTFGVESIPFAGYGTHIGLELVHEAPGPALLAAVHLHIQEASLK